jgi:catechol 2,3-dioxygenase-like lactoylglutathione lyase family enzyme
MALPLDHAVIAVPDLAQARARYEALGFHVLAGGEHPGRTSHNALVVFADGAYLELIAWRGPAPQERWWRTLQAHGEGPVDFALLPADTAQALAAAQARGLHTLHGPVDGGRVRPDGERLRWSTARHETPDVPFLCGDITPRRLRVPDGTADRTHPNGATGVAAITVAVHDLRQSLARYRALLGPDARIGAPHTDPLTGLASAAIALQGTTLTLQSPAAPAPAPAPEPAQALRQRLSTRGEGPCGIAIARGAGQQPLWID